MLIEICAQTLRARTFFNEVNDFLHEDLVVIILQKSGAKEHYALAISREKPFLINKVNPRQIESLDVAYKRGVIWRTKELAPK